MLNKPFFSVIIPLYNKEDYIKETLESVFNQNFKDFEIIVVNDGSTDASIDIVNTYTDEKLRIIDQENSGLSKARNIGIRSSKSDYIALLDADDLWMEDYLKTIYKLIQNNKKEFVFATNLKLLTLKDTPILFSKEFDTSCEEIITNYFKISNNIFGPSSLVIKKSVFNDIGYFNELINYGEGDEFFIKCFGIYNLVYYSYPKIYYRVGIKEQLTAPTKNSNRIIPDYEIYLKNNTNINLKKYIDFVHYKLVVLYKMEKNHKLVRFYKEKIDVSNLSFIRKIKFYMPTILFYNLKSFNIWFSNKT